MVVGTVQGPGDQYLTKESTDGAFTREQALFSNRVGRRAARARAAWEMPDVADDAYADGRVANEACRRLAAAAARPDKPFSTDSPVAPAVFGAQEILPRRLTKLPMPEIEVRQRPRRVRL